MQGRSIAKFDHVQTDKQLQSAEEQAAQLADPKNSLKSMSEDTKRVMAKLNSADAATVRQCLRNDLTKSYVDTVHAIFHTPLNIYTEHRVLLFRRSQCIHAWRVLTSTTSICGVKRACGASLCCAVLLESQKDG